MNQQTYYQKNIMIVEDDPDIAKGLQELCENQGFQVTTVDNGRICLLELEKGFQGIIILDVWNPVMACVHTIKKMIIDGFTDQNTIIVLTQEYIQGKEFDAIYPYIYEYITKPFDANILLSYHQKNRTTITKEKSINTIF